MCAQCISGMFLPFAVLSSVFFTIYNVYRAGREGGLVVCPVWYHSIQCPHQDVLGLWSWCKRGMLLLLFSPTVLPVCSSNLRCLCTLMMSRHLILSVANASMHVPSWVWGRVCWNQCSRLEYYTAGWVKWWYPMCTLAVYFGMGTMLGSFSVCTTLCSCCMKVGRSLCGIICVQGP